MANIASFGYYEGKKQILGIDKYFHLYLILYLDNDKIIVLEKNHRVGWKPYHPTNDEEIINVHHMNKPIKLSIFFKMENIIFHLIDCTYMMLYQIIVKLMLKICYKQINFGINH